jgi:hypothetical protein
MDRLVVFGCSHTYGYGLPDIFPKSNLSHSNFAWPSVLSKDLNLSLVNNAFPGWSNYKILHKILEFKFQPKDLVIILWATVDRDMLFLKDGVEFHVGCWNDDDITKNYYNIHSDVDMAVQTLTSVHHAECFLKTMGIKTKHFLYTNKFFNIVNQAKKHCVWFETDLVPVFISGMKKDVALDNLHYGVETHKELSKYIKSCIEKEKHEPKN